MGEKSRMGFGGESPQNDDSVLSRFLTKSDILDTPERVSSRLTSRVRAKDVRYVVEDQHTISMNSHRGFTGNYNACRRLDASVLQNVNQSHDKTLWQKVGRPNVKDIDNVVYRVCRELSGFTIFNNGVKALQEQIEGINMWLSDNTPVGREFIREVSNDNPLNPLKFYYQKLYDDFEYALLLLYALSLSSNGEPYPLDLDSNRLHPLRLGTVPALENIKRTLMTMFREVRIFELQNGTDRPPMLSAYRVLGSKNSMPVYPDAWGGKRDAENRTTLSRVYLNAEDFMTAVTSSNALAEGEQVQIEHMLIPYTDIVVAPQYLLNGRLQQAIVALDPWHEGAEDAPGEQGKSRRRYRIQMPFSTAFKEGSDETASHGITGSKDMTRALDQNVMQVMKNDKGR